MKLEEVVRCLYGESESKYSASVLSSYAERIERDVKRVVETGVPKEDVILAVLLYHMWRHTQNQACPEWILTNSGE